VVQFPPEEGSFSVQFALPLPLEEEFYVFHIKLLGKKIIVLKHGGCYIIRGKI
jgi:hypothetical protein